MNIAVGPTRYTYPTGSKVEFSEDRRLAFVLTPAKILHVLHTAGEIRISARLQLRIQDEMFGI